MPATRRLLRSEAMPRVRLALCLALLLAGTACSEREVHWTAVAPEDGSFRAELPGEVRRVRNSLDTPAGPAPIEMWVVEDGEHAFMVGFTEYPEKVRAVIDPSELLDSARDGAVARVRGRLLIDEKKQAGDLTGRRIEFDAEGGQVRVRGDLFVAGRRLYQAFATVEPQEIDSPEVLRFLDSFRILPRVSGETKLEGEAKLRVQ